jgi:uncharacterized protein YjbI with pentapeptide repeats
VEQKPQPRWRPTKNQAVWAIKVAVAPLIAVMVISIIWLLWRQDPIRIGENGDYMLRGVLTIVGILVLIGIGYRYEWTGFGERARNKTETQEIQRSKTLWDWMSLLFVPLMIAGIGIWFTWWQNSSQQALEARQRAQEAQSQARNSALQAYLDQMQHLVLDENLPNSSENDDVSAIARARTLTVLRVMGSEGKQTIVQFMYESSLIQKGSPIVSLRAADLSNANLRGVDLPRADLSGADLRDADLRSGLSGTGLSETVLSETDLSNANLYNADLSAANLSAANLSETNLRGANLRETYLIDADLSGADLRDADLRGAFLDGANLGGAYLVDANLRGAFLSNADLSNTNLSDADLSGADLSYATNVTEEQLERQTELLEGATMPKGSIHD